MSTQLKEALKLHKEGSVEKALALYELILKTEHPPLVAFLNASAVWRSQEKQDLAISCLSKGLSLYPDEPGLWNNLGNCNNDSGSLINAIGNYRRALTLKPDFIDSRISLAACLRELGHVHLAYATLKDRYVKSTQRDERQRLLIPMVEAILTLGTQGVERLQPKDLDAFLQLVEQQVHQQVGDNDPCRAGILLTQLWLQVDQLDRALISREKLFKDTKKFFSRPEKASEA